MLRNKSNYSSYAQNAEQSQSCEDPTCHNNRFGVELILVPKLLPVASDYIGSNTAVATSQISWSHHSVAYEATFRKMFGFGLIRQKASVSRWRWCSPGSNNFLFGFQRERVLGVYSADRAPVQGGSSKNVVNNYIFLCHANTWIPKQQPSKVSEPNIDPNLGQQYDHGFRAEGSNSESRKGHGQNRHDFARSRAKMLWIHPASFTQSQPQGGARL